MNFNLSTQAVTLIRGALMLLAVLFATDTIPTGIDGGGTKVAATLAVILSMIAAGDKTEPELRKAIQDGRLQRVGRNDNVLPNSQGAWIGLLIKALIAVLTAFVS